MIDDKLIIVSGEEDLVVCGSTSTPYIEATEEALETAFQALEIVSTTYVEPLKVNPRLSDVSLMVAKTMLKEGYKYGSGLGKRNAGSVKPLKLVENKGRYGLGYKPTHADRRRIVEERIERSQAKAGVGSRESQKFLCAAWIRVSTVPVGSILTKWQLLSSGIEIRASIMCTLVFLMKKLAIGNLWTYLWCLVATKCNVFG